MINRIGIVGAGAIGCSLGSKIFETYGDRFCWVASGKRAEKLRNNGVQVNGERLIMPVYSEPDGVGVEVMLLTVKNYSLKQTLDDIAPLVTPNTVIVPLLNGVTAVDEVRAAFPENIVPYGIVLRTNAERIGDNVTVTLRGEVQIGFARGESFPVDLTELRDLLIGAGIDSRIYPDMRYMQWRKWMVNIGANQVSALAGAQFKYFGHINEITVLLRDAIQEILEISRKLDIGLTVKDREDIIQMLIDYPPEKKTSMLQDIEARRKTEIDYFAGTVMDFGEKYGIPTPVNRMMYYALKAREKVGLAEAKKEKEK